MSWKLEGDIGNKEKTNKILFVPYALEGLLPWSSSNFRAYNLRLPPSRLQMSNWEGPWRAATPLLLIRPNCY